MPVLRVPGALLWLVLLVLATGCRENIPDVAVASDYKAPAAVHAAPAPVTPVDAVVGIDASGSGRPLRGWCFSTARQILADAAPGDRVDVRLIGSGAFDPSLRITSLHLRVPPTASAFDLRARMEAANDHTPDSLRAASLAAVKAAETRATTARTDLTGFLGAARVVMADADSAAAKVIVVCSDGDDTESAPLEADLSGIQVLFLLGAGTGDSTGQVLARTEEWRKVLEGRGARVRFIAPGSDVRLDDYRPASHEEGS